MKDIRINKRGIINSNDEYNKWEVIIEGNEDKTDPYIMSYYSIDNKEPSGFDDFIEKYEDISFILEERGWDIQWIN